MKSSCYFYKLRKLVIEPTCSKNPENQSCRDLLLTVETGSPDFHKLIITVMKSKNKHKSKTATYIYILSIE